MSQHPSLRSSEKMKQHRSVLKRFERLRMLKEKGEWAEEGSVFGLPKVKIVRYKIKKEKAAVAEGETAAAAAPGAGGAAATPGPGAKASGAEAKKPEAKEAKPKK